MVDTFKSREAAQAWQKRQDTAAPKAGDLAPDFELCDISGQHPVQLSRLSAERPVALIFGSFT